jgi:hypothetical protein
MRFVFAILVFSVALAAQTLPMAGVIVDRVNRAIRPVVAGVDEALAGTAKIREFDFAVAAPDGRNALVARDGDLYVIRRLDGALPVWRHLGAEKVDVKRAAWSENAEALALVDSTANRLELWTRMSYEPKRMGTVELTSVTERMVGLAVDGEGRFAFAATQGKETGTLYLLKPGQEPLMVMPLGKAGMIQLAGGALYVADRGRNEVIRLTNWERIPAVAVLASAGNGVADPVGFALDGERKRLYVASGETRQVLGIDLKSGAVKETLELGFAPTGLARLGQGPLFVLETGQGGALVLDARAQEAALLPVNAAGD